jgi:hypothetical protein
MRSNRILLIVSLLSLAFAVVILLLPVSTAEHWAVTVGTDSRGFVPVGSDTAPLVVTAFSSQVLMTAADRVWLVAASLLLGISLGTGLAWLASRRHASVP